MSHGSISTSGSDTCSSVHSAQFDQYAASTIIISEPSVTRSMASEGSEPTVVNDFFEVIDKVNIWVQETQEVALPPAHEDQHMIDAIYEEAGLRNVNIHLDVDLEFLAGPRAVMYGPRDIGPCGEYIFDPEEEFSELNPVISEDEFGIIEADNEFLMTFFVDDSRDYVRELVMTKCRAWWEFWEDQGEERE